MLESNTAHRAYERQGPGILDHGHLVWTNDVLDRFRNFDVDPAARMESFRALKLSRLESFRVLKC